ncbi:MAG: MarR family winged helix-turn-helix transcriptional regulator [Clostridium sp.]
MKEYIEDPLIGGLIQHISHSMFKEANRDLQQYNLTGVQANILIYLYFNECKGNIYQKDIEKHLHLTNPTVTGVVKRLEQKEFISRHCCEEDGRYKCHKLTDEGKKFARYAVEYMRHEKEKQILNGFSEDEIEFLKRLLKRILKNLGE